MVIMYLEVYEIRPFYQNVWHRAVTGASARYFCLSALVCKPYETTVIVPGGFDYFVRRVGVACDLLLR